VLKVGSSAVGARAAAAHSGALAGDQRVFRSLVAEAGAAWADDSKYHAKPFMTPNIDAMPIIFPAMIVAISLRVSFCFKRCRRVLIMAAETIGGLFLGCVRRVSSRSQLSLRDLYELTSANMMA